MESDSGSEFNGYFSMAMDSDDLLSESWNEYEDAPPHFTGGGTTFLQCTLCH